MVTLWRMERPVSPGEGFQDFRASGVILHGLRVGLRIGKHSAVGRDYGDACAASAQLRDPIAQRRKIFCVSRRSRCPLRKPSLTDPCDRSELFETYAFVVAAGIRSAKKSTASRTRTSSAKNANENFQKRLSRTSLEQVPRAAHGLQVNGVLRIAFDFFAQAADVNVHAARSDEAIRSPDGIEQLIPREDPVRARSKVIEQPEFKRAERNGLTRMAHAIGRRIDGQLADLDDTGRIAGGSARRSSALTRASSSRGLKGLVT